MSPTESFDYFEWLRRPATGPVMPGIDSRTCDYNPEIVNQCEAIRTEAAAILICAWNEDKESIAKTVGDQEKRKLHPKPITYTICTHHESKEHAAIELLHKRRNGSQGPLPM